MRSKKRVLLCWGYNRKGWIAPFEAIKNDFEFVYLFFATPDEEDACYTDCAKIYWNDYASGFDILHKIKPVAVVLMSITSGYAIALNAACKSSGIPTYIFQHGLYQTYKDYRTIEKLNRRTTANRQEESNERKSRPTGTTTLRFLWRSLSLTTRLQFPLVLTYFWLLRREGQNFAAFYMPLSIKKPTKYICYTPQNATIHKELDRVGEERLVYIGVPELDFFFNDQTPVTEENYYLLIDQPFAENRYHDIGVTKTQMNECYAKLNTFCKAQNARLVIKLHPENYKSTWLLQDENIEYKRDADNVKLIKKTKGVFGSISTLMLPALYFKPCYLLLIHNSSFQKFILSSGLAKGAPILTFKHDDINFNHFVPADAKEKFIYNFLYKTDGNSMLRLKEFLLYS